MTKPFDPSHIPAGLIGADGSGASGNTLPNGSYDIYNIGDLYDKTLFLGTVGSGQAHDTASVHPVTSTPQDYLKQFAQLSVSSPQQYAAMQQQMYAAGFYGATEPRLGIYSGKDADAMVDALKGYLGVVNPDSPTPLTITDYLDHASAQGEANGDGLGMPKTEKAPPPPVQYTSGKSLKDTLQTAAQQALHRDLDDEELSHFVSAFHGKELSAYNSYYGGQSAENPDAGAEAKATIQDDHGKEAHQALKASYTDVMNQLLGVTGG